MHEGRLSDSEILIHSFQTALQNPACPIELAKRAGDNIKALKESPNDKVIVEICAELYSEIHYLLKSK